MIIMRAKSREPGTLWSVLMGLILGWRRRYSGQARLS